MASLVLTAAFCSQLACTISDDTCGGQSGFRCSQLADESSSSADESGGACEAESPGVELQLENRTGNTNEIVYFVRCDGSDGSEFPLMPPGLPDGDDVAVPMPGPGCWLLAYSGEGCEPDMPHETAPLCAGDTYVWAPDALHHVCVG
ncbi:MAG: hypothetical protein IAG13_36135 [Deltaproteobacteria bacterium]|nr:hypothetical protein [Nannocystaceae bacterium]